MGIKINQKDLNKILKKTSNKSKIKDKEIEDFIWRKCFSANRSRSSISSSG